MHTLLNYIHGLWVPGLGEKIRSFDPATHLCVAEGHMADAKQLRSAVEAAETAFVNWSQLRWEERLTYLERFVAVLDSRQSTLAQVISLEVGKPLWESKTEVQSMIQKLAISVQAYQERTGHRESQNAQITTQLIHRPHGVVVVLGPFNFPGHLPNGHILPALLAGNAVIFKPSERANWVAQYVVECWHEAGLPKGVLNLVLGDASIAEALIVQSEIQGVFFTGSHRAGTAIHKIFSGKPEKILALEMGGNNPLVLVDVKDLEAAVYHTIQSAFISSGQRCTCARRLIMVEDAHTSIFLQHLVNAAQKIRVARYDNFPEPFMGPVISYQVAQNLLDAQKKIVVQGAQALLPMRLLAPNTGLVTPGILDVTAVEGREDTEYFGPLLQVVRCDNLDDAINEANHTRFGLAAGILSDDRACFDTFEKKIRAGVVNWNRPLTGASSALPFGGVGMSGNHRPSAYYAADYCAYPVASLQSQTLVLPDEFPPGLEGL